MSADVVNNTLDGLEDSSGNSAMMMQAEGDCKGTKRACDAEDEASVAKRSLVMPEDDEDDDDLLEGGLADDDDLEELPKQEREFVDAVVLEEFTLFRRSLHDETQEPHDVVGRFATILLSLVKQKVGTNSQYRMEMLFRNVLLHVIKVYQNLASSTHDPMIEEDSIKFIDELLRLNDLEFNYITVNHSGSFRITKEDPLTVEVNSGDDMSINSEQEHGYSTPLFNSATVSPLNSPSDSVCEESMDGVGLSPSGYVTDLSDNELPIPSTNVRDSKPRSGGMRMRLTFPSNHELHNPEIDHANYAYYGVAHCSKIAPSGDEILRAAGGEPDHNYRAPVHISNNENAIPEQENLAPAPPSTQNTTTGGGGTPIDAFMDVDEDPDEEQNRFHSDGVLRLDIDNFSEFAAPNVSENIQRLSKPVYIRGLPWRILAMPRPSSPFPRDNNRQFSRATKALGFFLQCNGDGEASAWNCNATASLKVLAQVPGREDHVRRISHPFNAKENDWGYSQFLNCDQLANPDMGYIKNDTVCLEVRVHADAPHGAQWDSRKHSGFIGLKNQGATCYMNSILQAFFFTTPLRKAVYAMPVGDDSPEQNVGLAMQRVFYELHHSDRPVATKKLTKSFGWDAVETFMQHDVQELCRVLLDNLESKMKGTPVENTIPLLLGGKMKTFIKCLNVPYESSRTEAFYDIQLNIKGKKNIIESFKEYTASERLDGPNKYDAGHFGLQPAEKITKFSLLPPVLHLQLMRFQFEGGEQKINDRFEFPEELDLTDFSVGIDSDDCVYHLHAVLVHSGDFQGGHYVVFINTNLEATVTTGERPRWCKFDDDVVSRATVRDAILTNYGGEDNDTPGRAFTNAYMLVYVRRNSISTVLAPLSEEEIPPHLLQLLETEREEEFRRKKEKMEAHLYVDLLIVLPQMIIQNTSPYDLVDQKQVEEHAPREKLEKSMSIPDFYKYMRSRIILNSDPTGKKKEEVFRMWRFNEDQIKRESPGGPRLQCYFRPHTLLSETDDTKTLDSIALSNLNAIYVEVPVRPSMETLYDDNFHILVFIKVFEPVNRRVRCLGHVVVRYRKALSDYRKIFNDMAGFADDVNHNYYEEVTPDMIRFIENTDIPLCTEGCLHEFKDGTIVIFEDVAQTNDKVNVKTFLQEFNDTIMADIELSSEPVSNYRDVENTLSETINVNWSTQALVNFIASKINYDSKRILLWHTLSYSDRPSQRFISPEQLRSPNYTVRHYLDLNGTNVHDPRKGKRYRILYAKTQFNIEEIDRRRQMKVLVMDAQLNVNELTIWPQLHGKVTHILEEAAREFPFAPNGSAKLRLLCIGQTPSSTRIYYVFNEETSLEEVYQKLMNANVYAARVEEIPLDQVEVGSNEYLLPVAHFDREPTKMFGVPFLTKVANGEPLTNVRDRIRDTLHVPEKEFEKFKFALVALNRVNRYLDMDSPTTVNLAELGSSQLHDSPTAMTSLPFLGIDHPNRRGSRSTAQVPEKSIRIHN